MTLLHKLFGNLLIVLVVVVVLLALCLDTTEARKKPGKMKKNRGCKYERKGEEGPCNEASNTKEITLPLKKGDSSCEKTQVVTKPCSDNSLTRRKKMKGCKYERKGSEWTECDPATNERKKVMKLKDGSNNAANNCPLTHTKTKSCGNNKKASRKSGGAKAGRSS